VAGIYLNRNTIEVLRHDFIVFTATRSCSALARGYFFGSSDSGCGKSAFCPLRLFTACRRMYSICPFTLRSSACAQLSRSSQSAGSIRRRNDFRSAIVTSQLSSLLYRQQSLTSFALPHAWSNIACLGFSVAPLLYPAPDGAGIYACVRAALSLRL
jgi:hypothetical protein